MSTADRLRKLTATAFERQHTLDRELLERRDDAPRPGDLFASPAAEAYPVQWLVLEASGGRLKIVPTDSATAMGRADLAVAEATTGAPLRARCRHQLVTGEESLTGYLRSGRLEAEQTAAVALRCEELAAAGASDSPEGGVESEDWMEAVVRPAVDAVREATVDLPRAPARLPAVRGPKWPLVRIAATLLALVGVGLTGLALWLVRDLRDLEAARVREREEHRRELEQLGERAAADRDRLARRVAALEAERADRSDGVEAELRQQLADLRERLASERARAGTLAQLPIVFLVPDETVRGPARALELPASVPRFVVVLQLDPVHLRDRYRVEAARVSDGAEVWRSAEIDRSDASWLGLELPGDRFVGGEYLLRLVALDGDHAVVAGRYRLGIRFR